MTQTTHRRHDTDETTEIDSSPETTTDPDRDAPERVKIDLSFTQLIAGAFAAMTAAVIGARLGVAGTVIGAALGSVVAGVAGSLYTASLQRGRRGLQTLAQTPVVGRVVSSTRTTTAVLPAVGSPSDDTQVISERIEQTQVLPVRADVTDTTPDGPATPTEERGTRVGFLRRRWKTLLVTSAVMFAIAVGGITAIELASGRSVSGGSGTTISQVGSSEGAAVEQPADDPSPTPSDEVTEEPTDEVTEEPTDEVTEEPTDEVTEEPTETPTTPTPSEEPTETPTDSPTEQPTETPTTGSGAQSDSSTTTQTDGTVDTGTGSR